MLFEASASPAEAAAALRTAVVYLALLVMLGVALSVPVMLRRRQAKIGIGDGGDKELLRRMRIHGNFIEQATLGLPVLALLPFAGAPVFVVHLIGGALLLGRLLHAQGLFSTAGVSFGRAAGMFFSWFALIGGAVALITYALSSGAPA